MPTKKYTREEIAQLIDHSVLTPFCTMLDVVSAARNCLDYGVSYLCLYPIHVTALQALPVSETLKLIAVIGFPGGMQHLPSKLEEIYHAYEADEYDIVANGSFLRESAYKRYEDEINRLVIAARPKPVKVILECCNLTHDQITTGTLLAIHAGAAFIKTSTGFGRHGAQVQDVEHIRRVIRNLKSDVQIKAAGDIRCHGDVQDMLAAGASRIGTSYTFKILDHWPKDGE